MSELPANELPDVLTLSAQFENLERVRSFATRYAEVYGLGPEDVYSVKLAVDEAFTNIVEHAYGGECDEEIECTCQITEEGLVISLRDCGYPFDPNKVPDPDLEAELQDREVGGLGLYFIRQLMDKVEFQFINEPENKRRCNKLRMVKRKEGPA